MDSVSRTLAQTKLATKYMSGKLQETPILPLFIQIMVLPCILSVALHTKRPEDYRYSEDRFRDSECSCYLSNLNKQARTTHRLRLFWTSHASPYRSVLGLDQLASIRD